MPYRFCPVANVAAEGLVINQQTVSLLRVRRTVRGLRKNLFFGFLGKVFLKTENVAAGRLGRGYHVVEGPRV